MHKKLRLHNVQLTQFGDTKQEQIARLYDQLDMWGSHKDHELCMRNMAFADPAFNNYYGLLAHVVLPVGGWRLGSLIPPNAPPPTGMDVRPSSPREDDADPDSHRPGKVPGAELHQDVGGQPAARAPTAPAQAVSEYADLIEPYYRDRFAGPPRRDPSSVVSGFDPTKWKAPIPEDGPGVGGNQGRPAAGTVNTAMSPEAPGATQRLSGTQEPDVPGNPVDNAGSTENGAGRASPSKRPTDPESQQKAKAPSPPPPSPPSPPPRDKGDDDDEQPPSKLRRKRKPKTPSPLPPPPTNNDEGGDSEAFDDEGKPKKPPRNSTKQAASSSKAPRTRDRKGKSQEGDPEDEPEDEDDGDQPAAAPAPPAAGEPSSVMRNGRTLRNTKVRRNQQAPPLTAAAAADDGQEEAEEVDGDETEKKPPEKPVAGGKGSKTTAGGKRKANSTIDGNDGGSKKQRKGKGKGGRLVWTISKRRMRRALTTTRPWSHLQRGRGALVASVSGEAVRMTMALVRRTKRGRGCSAEASENINL